MKVLIIGSGGREHALAWKLSQSRKIDKIFSSPGNGGISQIAQTVDIKSDDIDGLLSFAKNKKIDLTVVGPEIALVKGIVDVFEEEGLKIFGPVKKLAMLEASKVFAKDVMKKFNIPTADFKVFDKVDKAKAYLEKIGAPIVVKADGLAAGKGVIVATTKEQARSAINSMMIDKVFGSAGDRIILEECLEGEEVSMLIFTDSKHIIPLESSQDHKRIFDSDKGANTGGMGAYSPAPVVSEKMLDIIIKDVFEPVIKGLANEGEAYKGVLYAGLMITKDGPRVLEFNVRFGDPETQAIMPRLKSDIIDIMIGCIDGDLNKVDVKWHKEPAVCVVCASKGYPDAYETGKEVFGLDEANKIKDVVIFHAGTKAEHGKLFTNGGRVLGVTGLGKNIKLAKEVAYQAVSKIKYEGMYYRKDISDKAIRRGYG